MPMWLILLLYVLCTLLLMLALAKAASRNP